MGWKVLHDRLKSATDVGTFLDYLADETGKLMGKSGERIVRHADLDDRIRFAPTWFSQFLARRKLWVWPARYISRVMNMYPVRYLPLAPRLSVAHGFRGLADHVFRYHQNQRHTGSVYSLQVFTAAGLCGNTWEPTAGPLRWYPLVAFKESLSKVYESPASQASSSINAVYKLAVEHAGENLKRRPEAHFFLSSARLATTGVDAFNWVLNPTSFNTQLVSRVLGREITEVPAHVKLWAARLRDVLPLFPVKVIKQVEDALAPWLIFVMAEGPERSPADWQTIVRHEHVHDLSGKNTFTYWNFLTAHFAGTARGEKAISTMQKAYLLAAAKYGFRDQNPFDPKHDRIRAPDAAGGKRKDITSRKPLELAAWELIVRKNREGDYAFARNLGPQRCHFTLRNPETGEYEHVFWPAEAIVVDILLNSGMRHVSARWVDSGEGDQECIDRKTLKTVPNEHSAATVGRNRSFLQLVDLPGQESRKVLGQFVALNKTGNPFVIPWVDDAVVDSFYRMLDLQARYNPIRDSIKQIDKRKKTRTATRANPDLFSDVFPLFRDPSANGDEPVSEYKVLAYWKDLLRHCQPDVNKLFGFDYPLITDDGMIFDLHALRVTMVTNLLALGVDVNIVRDIVGHACEIMTWYYNGQRSSILNRSIQGAMEERSEAHEKLASGDQGAIEQYASEAVVPDFLSEHVGIGMLRNYKHRSDLPPYEIFLHGICPGGSCSTGGEGGQAVWRERACSGCRYRVTGPRFRNGIQNKINNLFAELRLSGKRMAEYSAQVEKKELGTGQTSHRLRRLLTAESSFRDRLSGELGRELRVQAIVRKVSSMAAAEGKSSDDLLLPVVPDFDPTLLEYGLHEVHEFELFHTLVSETRILPASIMEIPHGVESEMKKILNIVLRANHLSGLTSQLTDREETDVYLKIGDALLRRYPEAAEFQQLVEGAVHLDRDAVENVRSEVRAVLSGHSTLAPQLEYELDPAS